MITIMSITCRSLSSMYFEDFIDSYLRFLTNLDKKVEYSHLETLATNFITLCMYPDFTFIALDLESSSYHQVAILSLQRNVHHQDFKYMKPHRKKRVSYELHTQFPLSVGCHTILHTPQYCRELYSCQVRIYSRVRTKWMIIV